MNPDLDNLPNYLWGEYLQLVSDPVQSEYSPISMHIGTPNHDIPSGVKQTLIESLSGLSTYTDVRGSQALREAIASWLKQRFKLAYISPEEQILPVNGTREALFAFAQSAVDTSQPAPKVLMPNPLYEAYLGGAVLAGAEPIYMNCLEATGFSPDFSSVRERDWQDCQLLYLCSPNNPCGSIIGEETMQMLIRYAHKYDFIIASDECYSEIYYDENIPPVGLLQAAQGMGLDDFNRCIVFHSLSKRSNVPGLRSGFVAGDVKVIQKFEKYRTYHGCAMPSHIQAASVVAWTDEEHVIQNRHLYREKFSSFESILSPVFPISIPPGSFYLWLKTPISDVDFTRELYLQKNIKVVPGSYLAHYNNGANPGSGFVRLALVTDFEQCVDSAYRIKDFLESCLSG
ncbi:MAG: succinyldiaminopimelate transaminase [Rivularia sp. (in: cyanobacteria)]